MRSRRSRKRTRRMRRKRMVTKDELSRVIAKSQNQRLDFQPLTQVIPNFWDTQFGTDLDFSARIVGRIGNDCYLKGVRLSCFIEHAGPDLVTPTGSEPVKDVIAQFYVYIDNTDFSSQDHWYLTSDDIPLAYDNPTLTDQQRMLRRHNRRDIKILYNKQVTLSNPSANNSSPSHPWIVLNKYVPIKRKIIWKTGQTALAPFAEDSIWPRVKCAVTLLTPQQNTLLEGALSIVNFGVYWYWRE